jgi:hypothetical protein
MVARSTTRLSGNAERMATPAVRACYSSTSYHQKCPDIRQRLSWRQQSEVGYAMKGKQAREAVVDKAGRDSLRWQRVTIAETTMAMLHLGPGGRRRALHAWLGPANSQPTGTKQQRRILGVSISSVHSWRGLGTPRGHSSEPARKPLGVGERLPQCGSMLCTTPPGVAGWGREYGPRALQRILAPLAATLRRRPLIVSPGQVRGCRVLTPAAFGSIGLAPGAFNVKRPWLTDA